MRPQPQEEPQENDSLWALLAKAKKPVLPANFSKRVLQTIEIEQRGLQESESLRALPPAIQTPTATPTSPLRALARRLSLWTAAGVAAGLLVVLGLHSLLPPASLSLSSSQSKRGEEEQLVHEILSQGLSSGDLALLAQLHEVVDAELASLWTDALPLQ
jgi:ABC-type Fe2+-enterobactin transport system substrate-binding protein